MTVSLNRNQQNYTL